MITYWASAAPAAPQTLTGFIYVRHSNPEQYATYAVPVPASIVTTRARTSLISQEGITRAGEVVDIEVGGVGTTLQRGQMYVVIGVNRSGSLIEFARGYVYAGHGLSLGQFIEPGPSGGPGAIISSVLAQPGAGADYASSTVPSGAAWKHRGFFGTLTTAVAAANRLVRLVYTDGTNSVFIVYSGAVQAASIVTTYGATEGIGETDTNQFSLGGTDDVSFGLPETLLPAGFVITPTTRNIQGADQWSIGNLVVEEWVMANT